MRPSKKRVMYAVCYDGFSYADEEYSTLKEAKERQQERANDRYSDSSNIFKRTTINEKVRGSHVKRKVN